MSNICEINRKLTAPEAKEVGIKSYVHRITNGRGFGRVVENDRLPIANLIARYGRLWAIGYNNAWTNATDEERAGNKQIIYERAQDYADDHMTYDAGLMC